MKKSIFLVCLVWCVAAGAIAQKKNTTKPMTHLKTGFVHTVYFWLKEPQSQTATDSLYQGLQLLATIDLIQEGFIGVPAATRRPVIDHTYAYSITFVFKNQADQDVYQEHPIHKKFIAEYGHLWQKVQVYDAIPR